MKDLIEQQIIDAVRKLLKGRVNELLCDFEFIVPFIDFGNYAGGSIVTPAIALASCEHSEKERIIRLDAYSLTITFMLNETPECELNCYAYSAAVSKALGENPTLGGVVDRAMVTGKKYNSPKNPNCGEGWGLVITLRVTVENPHPCGFST